MEMNDSGVEFTTSALPLDSDTDVPDNLNSHKLLIESDTLAGVPPAISEGEHSATRTPDSILSASPVVQPKSGAQIDGDLIGATTPEEMAKVNELDAKTSKDASPHSEKAATFDPTNGTTTWALQIESPISFTQVRPLFIRHITTTNDTLSCLYSSDA